MGQKIRGQKNIKNGGKKYYQRNINMLLEQILSNMIQIFQA